MHGLLGMMNLFCIINGVHSFGCTPNWLATDNKFKCPCHGSGFRMTGIHFEGPAPRPLERFKIGLADDGQVLVDKTKVINGKKASGKIKIPSQSLEMSEKNNKSILEKMGESQVWKSIIRSGVPRTEGNACMQF